MTHNGHVYVTFRSFTAVGPSTDAIYIVKSTDCGRTFSQPQQVTTFIPSDAQDQASPKPVPTQAVSDDPASTEGTDAHSECARIRKASGLRPLAPLLRHHGAKDGAVVP